MAELKTEIEKSFCYWSPRSRSSWKVLAVDQEHVTLLQLDDSKFDLEQKYLLSDFEKAIAEKKLKALEHQNEMVKVMRG